MATGAVCEPPPAKKVAIVHYWLVGMRGGERVLEALCALYPQAHIYTHVVDRAALSDQLLKHDIRTTFIQRLPFARRWYQKYLPLMPFALEQLDLSGYDLIISSEAGPAKGVISHPDALHVTYCHSPMRYVWDQYHVYRERAGWLTRLMMAPIAHYLRIWDTVSAARVDVFIANSEFIARRIRKSYGRDAEVIYPPVRTEEFAPVERVELGDYYLWCGQLVAYKRPDLAIAAFSQCQRKLIVIGDGPELAALQLNYGSNITFVGKADFDQVRYYMARCRALIFPGEEDFGIVPVEVQAAGRPVIAYRAGGATETVVDGETGILFDEQSTKSLLCAIDRFEAGDLGDNSTDACVRNAERFTHRRFDIAIRRLLADRLRYDRHASRKSV